MQDGSIFRLISWRKSAATKLFQLISSGNRPPQNFFGSFPQEIGRHKTVSAHFLRKSAATKLFGSFPQEIGRHKTFRLISSGNRPPQTFSAHFLRKSAATKLFRLISSGNRPPQNFSAHFLRKSAATKLFGSFPQEIGRHKTFRLISSGNRWDGLLLISSGNRWMGFHSFPQEIGRHKTISAHFLRKSLGWPTSNSRYSYVKLTFP